MPRGDPGPESHLDLSRFENKHPSSDEFDLGAEVPMILEDEAMEGIIMHEVTEAKNNHGNPLYPILMEEGDTFRTAPSRSGSSHSLGPNNRNVSNSDTFYLKRPDLVPLPNQGQYGKKRFAESMRPPLSKKVSLGIIEPQSPMYYHVNHLSPTGAPNSEASKPEATKGQSWVNMIPISMPEGTRKMPSELRSTSFESNTSFSSITPPTNQIWTPNASYPVESAATSFNSSAEIADVPDNSQYKRAPQTHFFGDTALRLASDSLRSGIGNGNPNGVLMSKGNEVNESMIIAAEDKKPLNRNPDQYLAEQIFPSTLLSMLPTLTSRLR